MERRKFIQASGMALLALIVPAKRLRRPVPVLYGDGLHDDTDALQAWFDGKAVSWPDGSPVGDTIKGKHFLLLDTIHDNGRRMGAVHRCYFDFCFASGGGITLMA